MISVASLSHLAGCKCNLRILRVINCTIQNIDPVPRNLYIDLYTVHYAIAEISRDANFSTIDGIWQD